MASKQTLTGPGGIPSGEVFGFGVVALATTPFSITGLGIASGEAFGTSGRLTTVQTLMGAGIASAEAFGGGTVAIIPRTWEYMCLGLDGGPHAAGRNAAVCNQYAANGWELVSVDGGIAYLRRRVEIGN